MEKLWVAQHIGDTKTHAIQTLGVSIPQFTSRESCTPFLLKQLIQTPVKDRTRLISLRYQRSGFPKIRIIVRGSCVRKRMIVPPQVELRRSWTSWRKR
ncbi:Membrane-bound lytic murein transglycosylase B [Pseudomonas syringae pv. actinidiae]|uniref:Membrane-bound lytic murein transglycosylase B n=1 Tax=Pseudomonas syringae pv. actinidiae TaxID=103796 RepID=A0A2V0QQR7_PSESF|nr:Membrane-bound lytic murein transglycosylase B [Pseudomonas syringae pv. actinidiae]